MQNKVPKLQNINSFGSVITRLFSPSNGYTHHLRRKSTRPPITMKTPRVTPPHPPLLSETWQLMWNRAAGGVGEGGQVGLKRNGDYTRRTSQGRELSAGSLRSETYLCTCYMRPTESLGTSTYKYRQSGDPEHSQGKQKNKTKNIQRCREKGWRQEADHRMRERFASRSLVL